MLKEIKHEKSSRKDFAKVGDFIEMPNLIKVQRDSYEWFVEEGLGEVLKDISPIIDYSGNLVLEFFDYYMEEKTSSKCRRNNGRRSCNSKLLLH